MSRRRHREVVGEQKHGPKASQQGIDKQILAAARKYAEHERRDRAADEIEEADGVSSVEGRRAARLIAEVRLIAKVLDDVVPVEGETYYDQIQDKAAEINRREEATE